MSQYPNYLSNSYTPQGYMQGYPPMQQTANPYMDRLAQFQNQQIMQQQPIIQGVATRMVDDFNLITANDVPMDGTGAFFVKKDGSEIQHRVWTAQGTILTRPFKPVIEEQPNNVSDYNEKMSIQAINELSAMFESKFAELNEKFDKLENNIKPANTKRKDTSNE